MKPSFAAPVWSIETKNSRPTKIRAGEDDLKLKSPSYFYNSVTKLKPELAKTYENQERLKYSLTGNKQQPLGGSQTILTNLSQELKTSSPHLVQAAD